jgi:hypothetical protein
VTTGRRGRNGTRSAVPRSPAAGAGTGSAPAPAPARHPFPLAAGSCEQGLDAVQLRDQLLLRARWRSGGPPGGPDGAGHGVACSGRAAPVEGPGPWGHRLRTRGRTDRNHRRPMAPATTLNARNLEALGVPRPAELSLQLAQGDAAVRRGWPVRYERGWPPSPAPQAFWMIASTTPRTGTWSSSPR